MVWLANNKNALVALAAILVSVTLTWSLAEKSFLKSTNLQKSLVQYVEAYNQCMAQIQKPKPSKK